MSKRHHRRRHCPEVFAPAGMMCPSGFIPAMECRPRRRRDRDDDDRRQRRMFCCMPMPECPVQMPMTSPVAAPCPEQFARGPFMGT